MRARRRASVTIGDRDASQEGRGHTALVTGASSGIGRCITTLLAAKGYDVIAVARREPRLEELREELEPRWGVTVRPLVADLADPEAPASIQRTLTAEALYVDFLVNNAGYGMLGPYESRTWAEKERFIRVLGHAPIELTDRLLPAMVDRGWGRIINVSSIASLMVGSPGAVLYCAVKSMINKYSEGLDAEYARRGVRCTVSVPGITDTEIYSVSGIQAELDANRLFRLALMAPEVVAREAYAAVMAGKPMVVHGRLHRVWGAAAVHTPPAVRRRIAAFSEGMQHDELERAGAPDTPPRPAPPDPVTRRSG